MRAEYEEVASGDIALAIAALHTDENGVRAERPPCSSNKRHGTKRPLARRRRWPTSRARPRCSSRPSSQRSRASFPWRWPSSRRHRPRLLQQQSGRHRPRLLPRCQCRARHGRLPPFPRHHREAASTSSGVPVAASSSSNASCRPSQAATTMPSRRGAPTWEVSNFSQATWNEAAGLAGMPQLINVPPNEATPAEQDDLAIALDDADGGQSWDDSCRTS